MSPDPYISVTFQPATSIAPGDSTTFTITYDTTNVVGYSAQEAVTVTIESSDASNTPFTFTFTGQSIGGVRRIMGTRTRKTITIAAFVAAMVFGLTGCTLFGFLDSIEIQINGALATTYDFGSQALNTASQPVTVTVLNRGLFPLSFGGESAISVSGNGTTDFKVGGRQVTRFRLVELHIHYHLHSLRNRGSRRRE